MSGPSGTTTDTNATIIFDVNNLQPTQELSAPHGHLHPRQWSPTAVRLTRSVLGAHRR